MIEDLQSLCTAFFRRHHSEAAAANDGVDAGAAPVDGRAIRAFFLFLSMEDKPGLRVESAHTLVVLFDRLTLEQQHEVRDDAIPVLMELLRSDDERARTKADAALLELACCASEVRRDLVVGHLARGIRGDDPSIQLQCTKHIHRILAQSNPPIQDVVEAELVPRLVHFLERDEDLDFQFHAAQALNFISEGGAAHTNVVVTARAIPAFVRRLSSPDNRVKMEATLGLGKIAAKSRNYRDSVLQEGAMVPHLELLRRRNKLTLLRNAVCTLAIFYHWKPHPVLNPPDQQRLENVVIPRLVGFLQRDDDPDLQLQAARALSNVAKQGAERTLVVVNAGAIPAFVRHLSSPDDGVKEAAARGLSHIARDNPNHRDSVLEEQAMQPLLELLRSRGSNPTLLRAVTRAISDLCHGDPRPSHQSVQEILDSGVLRKLTQFLQRGDDPWLQRHAVRAISSIVWAAADRTHVVVTPKVTHAFVQLLGSPSNSAKVEAALGLSYIAGDNHNYRDLVLQNGAVEPLLALVSRPGSNIALLRAATRALSNLCRGEPRPAFEVIGSALPTFAQLIAHQDDAIVAEACSGLNWLTKGNDREVEEVIDGGVCRRLVELLQHPSPTVQEPVLLTIGNILKGSKRQTNSILKRKPLNSLLVLHESPNSRIKELACWSISEIVSIGNRRIQAVIDYDIIPSLIQLLDNTDVNIRKQAAQAILNFTDKATVDQVQDLVAAGCIPPLCGVLNMNADDSETVSYALGGLENILHVGWELQQRETTRPRNNPMVVLMASSSARGRSKLRELRRHPDDAIRRQACDVLNCYFGITEDDEWDAAAIAGTERASRDGDGNEPPSQRRRID